MDTYNYQDEQAIIWLSNPSTFPFCREAITDFGRRYNQPRHDTRRIQAYVVSKAVREAHPWPLHASLLVLA